MRPTHLLVLPRDSEQVFDAGNDLLSAIEWMCNSGQLGEPFVERDFEPFDSRKLADDYAQQSLIVVDPEGESLDDLVDLGKRWAERHSARTIAVNDLKQQVGADATSTLLWEAIALEAAPPYDPGYVAIFRIIDKASGLDIGTFTWNKNDSSHGFDFKRG
jgi:hypothetical protein